MKRIGVEAKTCRRLLLAATLSTLAAAAAVAQTTIPPSSGAQGDATALSVYRERLDRLLWAPELLARKYEAVFVRLWDALLQREQRFEVLSSFPFSRLVIGERVIREMLERDVRRTRYSIEGGERVYTPEDWTAQLKKIEALGYAIVQTEWHHEKFVPPAEGQPARSEVKAVLHVARENPAHRIIVRATLDVTWAEERDAVGDPVVHTIVVRSAEVFDRQRPAVFREVFRIASSERYPRLLPLLVQDLDRDGLSEIVLAGANMVIRNLGAGKFEPDKLLDDERSLYDGGVMGDFTGDGLVDLVAVDAEGYPLLYEGTGQTRFQRPARRAADVHLTMPKAFTAGDIDADGDLDLFIASYKFPYRDGQMPTPYYDANDGYPAYLLRNDGDGRFTDVTEPAGLAKKRNRRTFTSSFVDLDEDGDMDLIVVSDFAGLDVYENDGHGNFRDITSEWRGDTKLFGMGHTFGDYDLDGRMDLYVIGMSSTTARRLESLGLERPDMPEHNAYRMRMAYGNRMYLRREDGFVEAPFRDQVARTGWSWGASSFDFDNDGDKDIFVANGHYSGRSSEDYCSTFWRQDIYTEGSDADPARNALFQIATRDLRQADISWNGYEHKVLMLNRAGEGFVDVGFLMGVAFEYDGRAVVAEDLDADGRVDLLVVEFRTAGLDRNDYILHVYQNVMEDAGRWIGVRLAEHGPGLSPIGAEVTVEAGGVKQSKHIVTGDSFSAQHAPIAHFGLGDRAEVDALEVRWPNGAVRRIERPLVGRYHSVTPPPGAFQARAAGYPF